MHCIQGWEPRRDESALLNTNESDVKPQKGLYRQLSVSVGCNQHHGNILLSWALHWEQKHWWDGKSRGYIPPTVSSPSTEDLLSTRHYVTEPGLQTYYHQSPHSLKQVAWYLWGTRREWAGNKLVNWWHSLSDQCDEENSNRAEAPGLPRLPEEVCLFASPVNATSRLPCLMRPPGHQSPRGCPK